MRYTAVILFSFLFLRTSAQELQTVNYDYLYNPTISFGFDWKVLKKPGGWDVYYNLVINDSSQQKNTFGILWETRKTIREEKGHILQTSVHDGEGKLFFPADSLQEFLVAKVVNLQEKRAWYFYQYLSPDYPVEFLAYADKGPVLKPYLNQPAAVQLTMDSGKVATAFFYQQDFPPAAPPFSEGLSRVSAGMLPDSLFSLTGSEKTTLNKTGLYLIQQDTSSAKGIAFRVEDDYPKFRTIQHLAGPIQYICTRQEYEKLIQAQGDKNAFDKVILGITGNKERAKNFMRSYFQNVELANRYFTSYKEGWKTDRGMIFIIMGLPSSVFKFTDREVWEYKTQLYNMSFTFVRSPTIFDPDNYVLIRDKQYQIEWFEIVDLWRKARF